VKIPTGRRRSGASGLKVSKLWLGAMMFGDQTDAGEAASIVAATRDAGLNAIGHRRRVRRRRVRAHRRAG
jgi:hypothetical protein